MEHRSCKSESNWPRPPGAQIPSSVLEQGSVRAETPVAQTPSLSVTGQRPATPVAQSPSPNTGQRSGRAAAPVAQTPSPSVTGQRPATPVAQSPSPNTGQRSGRAATPVAQNPYPVLGQGSVRAETPVAQTPSPSVTGQLPATPVAQSPSHITGQRSGHAAAPVAQNPYPVLGQGSVRAETPVAQTPSPSVTGQRPATPVAQSPSHITGQRSGRAAAPVAQSPSPVTGQGCDRAWPSGLQRRFTVPPQQTSGRTALFGAQHRFPVSEGSGRAEDGAQHPQPFSQPSRKDSASISGSVRTSPDPRLTPRSLETVELSGGIPGFPVLKVDDVEVVVCPLNKAHAMKPSRLQRHIVKCLKTYKGTKVRCPYNATEYLEPWEFEEHMNVCKGRLAEAVHFASMVRHSISYVQHTNPPEDNPPKDNPPKDSPSGPSNPPEKNLPDLATVLHSLSLPPLPGRPQLMQPHQLTPPKKFGETEADDDDW